LQQQRPSPRLGAPFALRVPVAFCFSGYGRHGDRGKRGTLPVPARESLEEGSQVAFHEYSCNHVCDTDNQHQDKERATMIDHKLLLRYSLVFFLAPVLACTANDTPAPAEKKTETTGSYTVGKGPLKEPAQLDAVFESMEMKPVKLDSSAWSRRVEAILWTDWTVLEAVTHGTRVKKGDTLLKLDTSKVTALIDDMEQAQPADKAALELAQAELQNMEQTNPLKLQSSQRVLKETNEEAARYEKSGRAEQEKSAKFGIRSAQQLLDNATEELEQLQKMYRAKDLVEETEEIVLKRQKFAVESAARNLENVKRNADWEVNTIIPRWDRYWNTKKQEDQFALDFAKQSLPMTLAKKRLEVEKMKHDLSKSQQRLADLKSGLESLNVRAPMDGIVYYGACENGRWTTGGSLEKKLVPGGKVSINEVFMTVVNPARLQLKTSVPEGELSRVRAGAEGEASPVSASDRKFTATVETVSEIPLAGGGYQATISFRNEAALRLVPGMLCKVSVPPPPKVKILLVWTESLFTEGNRKIVYVQKPDGQPEKRTVKTGESNEKMVEILEGLAEGEKILMKKPE